MPTHARLAWLRLNAYGILLAGLAIMALTDLINPAGTDLARLAGDIPPGQAVWVGGFVASGLLLLLGFIRGDRLAETIGLVILTLALTVQAAVAMLLLGWTDYTGTRLILLALVGTCTWARTSVLWAREGLQVTIPARDDCPEDACPEDGA